MFKYLKKHQKKALAVLCVVSMIMFIKGLAPSGNANGYTDVTFGDLNGTKITQSQIGMARDEWTLLMAMRYAESNPMNQNQPIPLPMAKLGNGDLALGQAIMQKISENAGTFFLLVREATLHGCTPPDEEVRTYLTSYVSPQPDNVDEDRAMQAVSDLLAVSNWLSEVSNTVKITQPMLNMAVAKEYQSVSLNFVSFAAARYLPEIAAPTDAQIRNQYDAFKDHLSGQIDPLKNPLGFGYMIEPRIKLQYIGVSHDEVRKAVIKSKDPADWYVQAFGAFKDDRAYYDDKPLPATQPSVDASTTQASATTQGASTQAAAAPSGPTTRRVDNLEDDFRLHAQVVLDSIYDAEADKLQQTILKKIQDTMVNGWGALSSAQKAGGAATQSSQIVKIKSYDFIKELANSIQKEFGLASIYQGDIDQFKTRAELGTLADIGKAGVQAQQRLYSFAEIAMDPSQVPFKPTLPVQDTDRNEFLFRLTEMDPAHTLPFDEVKDRAANDWKLSQAYAKALAAAQSFLAEAQAKGFGPATTRASDLLITTEPFTPAQMLSSQGPAPSIPPLNLKPDSLRELAGYTLNLINTPPPSTGRHPLLVAELHPDAMVAVIELNSASFNFHPDLLTFRQAQTYALLRAPAVAKLLPEFVTYDAIAQRMNFKAEANARAAQ